MLICVMLVSCAADAHPGRLDSNGGHYNRKTGEYHYHRGGGSSGSSSKSTKAKSKSTTSKKSTATNKVTRANKTLTVDEQLKANGFLLSDEIEEIWEAEQTPNVLDKFTLEQQKAIVEELRKAQDEAAKSSLDFGKGIKNASDRAEYQEGVRKNKVLKATRAIAKKYGIQAGDIFIIEGNVTIEAIK